MELNSVDLHSNNKANIRVLYETGRKFENNPIDFFLKIELQLFLKAIQTVPSFLTKKVKIFVF